MNVMNGMTGAFVIEGASYDDVLNVAYGPNWTQMQPIFVVNQLGTLPNLLRSPTGRLPFSVNGQQNPQILMRPKEVQLWRIVNTSSASFVYFRSPPAGFTWRRLAQDGVQVPYANYLSSENARFLLAPGNRIDLLVQAPADATPEGAPHKIEVASVVSRFGQERIATLFSVKVDGADASTVLIGADAFPQRPAFLDNIPAGDHRQRTLAFNTEATDPLGSTHTIDDELFNGDVGALVLLNTTEEWRVENHTVQGDTPGELIDHPFHIHINPFQVVEHFDPKDRFCPSDQTCEGVIAQMPRYKPATKAELESSMPPTKHAEQCWLVVDDPSTWRPCADPMAGHELDAGIWWDVYPIPSGAKITHSDVTVEIPGYYVMLSNFVDYPGFYVIHCHILAHEDRGMITIVEVSDYVSPYSHH